MVIPVLPLPQSDGQTRGTWFDGVVRPYSKIQRDFINDLPPEMRRRLFERKILRGGVGRQIADFMARVLRPAPGLTTDEQAFLAGVEEGRPLAEQGVEMVDVEDYSSGRGGAPGAIVYKLTFRQDGKEMNVYMKGVDLRSPWLDWMQGGYEAFFYALLRSQGLPSLASAYYDYAVDPAMTGYTLMQSARGEDANALFESGEGLRFQVRRDDRGFRADLIRGFARLAAVSDLVNKGDRKIIQNVYPSFPANYLIDRDTPDGRPVVFGIDHAFLFNPNNDSTVLGLERAGNSEMGIIQAFEGFDSASGREELFAEFASAYLETWGVVQARAADIEALVISYFGRDSYEHNIIRATLRQDPAVMLDKEMAALLRFVEQERARGVPNPGGDSQARDRDAEGETLSDNESSSSPVADSVDPVGGIDLNEEFLDLRTNGRGAAFGVPDDQGREAISIEGLSPVIFQVVPTNLPDLLGNSGPGAAAAGEPLTPILR